MALRQNLEYSKELCWYRKVEVVDPFFKIHDLASQGNWLHFQSQACFPPVDGPEVLLDSCWLQLTCGCHLLCFYVCLAMLVVVMAHRYCSCVGLFNCFLPLLDSIVFSRSINPGFILVHCSRLQSSIVRTSQ